MSECFVGRQPILNRANATYGYELLYRNGLANAIGEVDRTVATSRVLLHAVVDIGLDKLVAGRDAYLHVSEQFLLSPELAALPSGPLVLQVSDPVAPTPEVVDALTGLRERGFRIALNGFRRDLPLAGLLPLADVVKLDAVELDNAAMARELEVLRAAGVTVIAKRVETMQRRDELAALGIDGFQGHFLAHPEVVTGSTLPTNQLAVLELVSKLSDPNLETWELERLISSDPALSLRVLRFVNSPLSGLVREVESIQKAVVLVGRDLIRTWVMVLAMAGLDHSVPELVKAALIRARMCEHLAVAAGRPGKDGYFTVGLFSLMDALMHRPMAELMEQLPLRPDLKAALMSGDGPHGEALRCAVGLEDAAPDCVAFQGLDAADIADAYLESLLWADAIVTSR